MRPMASSASRAPPDSTRSALADSARSRSESTSVPSRSNAIRPKVTVFRERGRRLPDFYPDHGKPLARRIVEDQTGDPLDRRVAVEKVDRLAERRERRNERVVLAQDHLVIELAIDPAFHDPLDVAEIADHVAVVELAGAHLDFGGRVVAVRMLADAVVIKQAVAVAELNLLGNRVH